MRVAEDKIFPFRILFLLASSCDYLMVPSPTRQHRRTSDSLYLLNTLEQAMLFLEPMHSEPLQVTRDQLARKETHEIHLRSTQLMRRER